MIRRLAVLFTLALVGLVACDIGGGDDTTTTSTSSTTTIEAGEQSWRLGRDPAPIAGCPGYHPDSVIHSILDGLQLHERSPEWINFLGGSEHKLHVSIGTHLYMGSKPGMPINYTDASTPRRTVDYYGPNAKGDRAANPVPIPVDFRLEGWPNPNGAWDHKLLSLDTNGCVGYELIAYNYALYLLSGKARHWAMAGARWPLDGTAGLAVGHGTTVIGFPLIGSIIRQQEVLDGTIDHVVWGCTDRGRYGEPTWPARKTDGPSEDPSAPPLGARLRLPAEKAAEFTGHARVIADALTRHGLILGDTCGHRLAIYGESVEVDQWDVENIRTLNQLNISDFEVVDQAPMVVSEDSWQVR